MKNTAAVAFAALAVSAVVAGCNNGNVAAPAVTPAPSSTPSVACTAPPGEEIEMVFPQAGPTMVPNAQGIIIATAPNPLPTSWYVYVSSSAGTATGGFLTAAPTPLPTPFTVPQFPNPNYQLAPFGIFATGLTNGFTAYLANTNCYPGLLLGAFTP